MPTPKPVLLPVVHTKSLQPDVAVAVVAAPNPGPEWVKATERTDKMSRWKLKPLTPNRRTDLKKQLTRQNQPPRQPKLSLRMMDQSEPNVARRRARVVVSPAMNANRWQSTNCSAKVRKSSYR